MAGWWQTLIQGALQLVRHFDFALVDPAKPWNCRNIGIFQQKEMWMTVTRRQEI
jgi:hypothetical protein